MILIIKHIEIEGPGTLGDFLRETARETKILELGKKVALPSMDGCEAIISLGGPMNVYEEAKYPFLKNEVEFLKRAVNEEIPVLGICLGAQMLAKACGAKVRKADKKEVGWFKVNMTDEGKRDPLFENMPVSLSVFQWHEDTFDIPEGAAHLVTSRDCPNQAFRLGKNAYGLQFHIEVTPQMIESWIRAYTKNETMETKDMLIKSYKINEASRRQVQMFYNNFSRIIAASQKMKVD